MTLGLIVDGKNREDYDIVVNATKNNMVDWYKAKCKRSKRFDYRESYCSDNFAQVKDGNIYYEYRLIVA